MMLRVFNFKLLYCGQPRNSPHYLRRCLDVVPSLLELALGHLSALVTSPFERTLRCLAEPFQQVLLVGVQLHVRSFGRHPMPGKVKTVNVESGFLACFASRIVQLTRRESFFLQLSFSSPLLVIQSSFPLPMFPTPSLYLLLFLALKFPSFLGIVNVKQSMILHFLSAPSFGSDYVLCQPSNLSGVQASILCNGSIIAMGHNPLSLSNHDAVRQGLQLLSPAIIPSLYPISREIRLRGFRANERQETLQYQSL